MLLRLQTSLAVLAVGVCVVVGLAPGGLGDPGPVEVTTGTSASAYRSLAGRGARAPQWLRPVIEHGADAGLLVLGFGLLVLWWYGRRRVATGVVAGAVLTGVATAAAYLGNEAVKLIVDEERPCRAIGVRAVARCPAPGDWSFPSNHAVLAGALAVGILLIRPRAGLVVVPVAAAVAFLRVLAGVHYPHDVIAGLTLGGSVAAVAVLALMPAAIVLVRRVALVPGLKVLVVAGVASGAEPSAVTAPSGRPHGR
jgi:membrane-associated phospholipid phosphatase